MKCLYDRISKKINLDSSKTAEKLNFFGKKILSDKFHGIHKTAGYSILDIDTVYHHYGSRNLEKHVEAKCCEILLSVAKCLVH